MDAPFRSESEGLAEYTCVKENATEGEHLLVDVALVSVDGRRTKPLRAGKTADCISSSIGRRAKRSFLWGSV
jgi:hypothetical protein